MIFDEESIQLYSSDILDGSIALIESAMDGKSVELKASNSEQFNNIYTVMGDIFDNFTYYYYAYGDNYTEHPSYGNHIDKNDEECCDTIDRYDLYSDNDNNRYKAILLSNKEDTTSNIIFEVTYKKVSDAVIKVLFRIVDRNKCQQALQAYFNASNYEWFQSDYENVLSKEGQAKQLYNLLTENDYNLNSFHVDDIKYIKAICDYGYQGKLFIHSAKVYFNKDNELSCKCIISDNGFVFDYYNEHILEDVKTEIKTVQENKSTSKMTNSTNRLTDIEKQVISARAYLQENSGKLRVSYRDIAEFLTNNGIYKINENNIKQKVSSIYAKLDIQDLGVAVALLKEANDLIAFDNVKIS